jgi:hypothetical protein
MVVTEYGSSNIYFYQGESSYRTIATNCSSTITSVLFDNNNQMIVSCYDSNIYIYNVTACYNATTLFVEFDSKDRLVVICTNRVEIFY